MFEPEKYTLVSEGSSKNKYRDDDQSLIFHFLKRWSAFDVGPHPDEIPGKGVAICSCAVKSALVAQKLGVPTCFIERIADDAIRVHEAQVIVNRNPTLKDENYVLPAELIDRYRSAGSFDRDFRSGAKKPEDYGLPAGIIPAVGTPFPFPVEFITTKFEPTDRPISAEEACLISGIHKKDLEAFWRMIHRLKGALHYIAWLGGYYILDGKCEGIVGPGRRLMLGDVVLTPDEDRPVPANLLDQGVIEHYSKEFQRERLIKIGYYDAVKAARKEGLPDPPYPTLPDDFIAEAARRYNAFAAAYAGECMPRNFEGNDVYLQTR
ncbi:MAG: phosphoribosylaminoimidazolesuccinocarboxamide synthase [Candidatus Moranbacteria bacterium]|nr:phosphoribosylaminoimidazolesuccinocarboxamide synthase [Candidatus Moranbacteria bacterium]